MTAGSDSAKMIRTLAMAVPDGAGEVQRRQRPDRDLTGCPARWLPGRVVNAHSTPTSVRS
jgi:hypothetical protein